VTERLKEKNPCKSFGMARDKSSSCSCQGEESRFMLMVLKVIVSALVIGGINILARTNPKLSGPAPNYSGWFPLDSFS
jgi:hypothetical protein